MINCILINSLTLGTSLTLNRDKFGTGFGIWDNSASRVISYFFSGQALKIRDCSKKFGTDGHLSLSCSPIVSCILTVSLFLDDKGKGKGRALVIAPHSRHGHLRGDQVHGAHHAASHIPALYLPSRSWYSFTDPERMEG